LSRPESSGSSGSPLSSTHNLLDTSILCTKLLAKPSSRMIIFSQLLAHLQQSSTLVEECSGDICVTCSGIRCACSSSRPSSPSSTQPCTSLSLARGQPLPSGSGQYFSVSVETLFFFQLPRLYVLAQRTVQKTMAW